MNNEWEREQRTSGWIHIDITLTRINMKRIFFVLAARSSIRSLTNRIDEIVLSAVLDRLHHLHLLWEFRIARKLPLNLNCTRPQCTHTKHRWVIFCCGFWMVCCQRFSPFSHCARNRMRRNCAHISLIIICSWHETLAKLNEIFLELANKTVYLYIRVFIKNRTPDVLFHFSRDIYVIVCVCVGVACSSSTTVDTITYVCCLSSSSMEAYFGRNDSCDADDWMRYDWFGEKKIFISFFDGENIDRWFGVSVFVCRGRLYRNHKHEK